MLTDRWGRQRFHGVGGGSLTIRADDQVRRRVTICLDPELLDQVDQLEGSRSEHLNRALAEYLGREVETR